MMPQCNLIAASMVRPGKLPLRALVGAVCLLVAAQCLAASRCPGELASPATRHATAIRFVNQSASPVSVYWIDFQGNRTLYKGLQPDEGYVQQTYLGHVWAITDASGNCLKTALGSQGPATVTLDRTLEAARPARDRADFPSPQPAAAGAIRKAHALVLGNAQYPGSARLTNTIHDATAIADKLRSMGFVVTLVTEANRQRLVQALTQFRRTAADADLSLFFYAGHGVQILGKNYILPIDIDQSDIAQATIQGVSLNDVAENFLPGKTKLLFLDACRDNPLQRSGDRSVTKGLAPISVVGGTLISYATKDGQTASDGVGARNSPFTQALLQHLADPQDIGVVLRKVREKVLQLTGGKQEPWEYGSLTGGELVLSRIQR
jgi:hypothetical protein